VDASTEVSPVVSAETPEDKTAGKQEATAVPKESSAEAKTAPSGGVILPPTASPHAAEPTVVVAVPKRKKNRTLQEFLGALSHFGMGKERNAIVQNLATMLNAGLTLVDALRTLKEEARGRASKSLLQRLIDRVESGQPLWRSMDEEHFFAPDSLALVRIGEEAGDLAQNMEYLSVQQEKDQALSGKIKMAMIYPGIVLTLLIVMVLGLGIFILPNLMKLLTSMNAELPLASRIVLAITNAMSAHGVAFIAGTIIVCIAMVLLAKYSPLKVGFQWITFHIPGIGRLMREATIARFGVILGGLLRAGVPLPEALRSLADVTTVIRYSRLYKTLYEHINIGDSFQRSFAAIHGSTRLLPPSVQQLVMTGERTGTLSKILLKVAEIYEHKANETAQKLPIILEPMLMLIMGLLVGVVAFAVLLPIYGVVGKLAQ
jgi:type IV pilus assembly protein PilC